MILCIDFTAFFAYELLKCTPTGSVCAIRRWAGDALEGGQYIFQSCLFRASNRLPYPHVKCLTQTLCKTREKPANDFCANTHGHAVVLFLIRFESVWNVRLSVVFQWAVKRFDSFNINSLIRKRAVSSTMCEWTRVECLVRLCIWKLKNRNWPTHGK